MGWVLHARVESQNGAGNLTHELNFEDKPEYNNEYGDECKDINDDHEDDDEDDNHCDHEEDDDYGGDDEHLQQMGPCLDFTQI